MKSNFELADELGRLAIETIKDVKMQNKILTNLKMLFDNQDYNSLPNPYKMGLEELSYLKKWLDQSMSLVEYEIFNQLDELVLAGISKRQIAEKTGIPYNKILKATKEISDG